MAQQEPQLDEKTTKSLMIPIDINALHLTGNQVLILHEEQNREALATTSGGILLSEKSTEKVRMGMITNGTVIKVGPKVEDPNIQPGKQALFFRHESEGGIKGTDDLVYIIYREYNIKGVYPTPPAPVVTQDGTIENMN